MTQSRDKITSKPVESTGDGVALAYEAGAELIDNGSLCTSSHRDGLPSECPRILVTEGVRGEGGILTTGEGRRLRLMKFRQLQSADGR